MAADVGLVKVGEPCIAIAGRGPTPVRGQFGNWQARVVVPQTLSLVPEQLCQHRVVRDTLRQGQAENSEASVSITSLGVLMFIS